MYRIGFVVARIGEIIGDLEQLQRMVHTVRHADFTVIFEFGYILGIVDRDPDSVIALEFADHLSERQRVQVHQSVDPAEVVRIGYPVEFEMSVDQVDLFVGGENEGFAADEAVRDFQPPFEQRRREVGGPGIGQDVEFRTQHLGIAGESFHDERTGGIVLHLEHGLARNLDPACLSGKNRRVFQLGARIEPYSRPVAQGDGHALSVGRGNGHHVLGTVFEDPVGQIVAQPGTHEQHGGGSGTPLSRPLPERNGASADTGLRLSGQDIEIGNIIEPIEIPLIFRCLFPFLNLMYPSMNQKMQEGLVNAYLESGFLPEWASPGHRDCMVGNNSASVVADAYIKGLRGYDIETLWEALKHDANAHLRGTASGRLAYDAYNKLGYVPNNIGIGQNVARTLEYAYNDWTIYTLGKKLGKPASEIDIFKQRALNYKNVYHPERKLMVGKDDKGVFNPKFDAVDWSGEFCEGNSWHWSFCVFHDPQGLIDLMGGKKEFNNMMDSVFVIPGKQGMESRGMIHEMREMQVMNMGQYAHGNQPIQHMVYLYNYSGEPWKAQHWVREIMDKLYTAGPDGYCGDEDNGQTSAWYVFSALGFYPVCPGTDQYILGTPLFKSAKLHLENGKTVTIKANNNNTDNRYVKDMKVNGKAFTRNYLTHDQLLKGANIQYQMSPTPNKQRGTTEKDIPYSLSFE